MANALICLLFHPLAVIAHILRKPLCSAPAITHSRNLCIRIYRSFPCEAWWNLNHSLIDGHSHRIQVVGVCFQPKALRLEWDGSTTGKWVKKSRRIIIGGFQNFSFCGIQDILIIGIFPYDEIFENLEETLAFFVLVFLCRKLFRMRGRIIHQAGPDDRSGRSQGPPSPPQMQRGGMPMSNGFLPGRFGIDFLQRQCHLN